MATIKEDIYGLYAVVDGWIARPIDPTEFKVGDKPKGKHFGGSSCIGMGKTEGRGEYKEYWHTSGGAYEHKNGDIKTVQMHRGF